MVLYQTDVSHFYFLNPTLLQTNNIYFMELIVKLKDNIWDIFDFSEYELDIIEYSHTQSIPRYTQPKVSQKDRYYVKLYLRQSEFMKIYKREEYDMLSYLGDMGGLLDIIIFVGIGLSSSIVARLF